MFHPRLYFYATSAKFCHNVYPLSNHQGLETVYKNLSKKPILFYLESLKSLLGPDSSLIWSLFLFLLGIDSIDKDLIPIGLFSSSRTLLQNLSHFSTDVTPVHWSYPKLLAARICHSKDRKCFEWIMVSWFKGSLFLWGVFSKSHSIFCQTPR